LLPSVTKKGAYVVLLTIYLLPIRFLTPVLVQPIDGAGTPVAVQVMVVLTSPSVAVLALGTLAVGRTANDT